MDQAISVSGIHPFIALSCAFPRSSLAYLLFSVKRPYKLFTTTLFLPPHFNISLTSRQGQADERDPIDGNNLISDVQTVTSGGRTTGHQIGHHNGRQNRSPTAFDDHHSEDLSFLLRDHHLDIFRYFRELRETGPVG